MADARKARRDAEKVARDALSGTLVGTAGDLGVAHAARQDAPTEIETATKRGQEIVAAAQSEAATLVSAAEHSAGEGTDGLRRGMDGGPRRGLVTSAAENDGLREGHRAAQGEARAAVRGADDSRAWGGVGRAR